MLVVAGLVLIGTPAEAADRFWVGGGFGLGFGDIEFVDLNGVFAYRITPRISTGLRLTWRNRTDTRFDEDLTTNDYGAAIFGRGYPKRPFFVHAEYEVLDWEAIRRSDLSTSRERTDSFFVGGGIAQPISKNVSVFVTLLYNLTYDDDEVQRPYDSPVVFRAGVGFTF